MNRVLVVTAVVSLLGGIAPHAAAQTSYLSFGAGAGGEGVAYGVNWTVQTNSLSFSARFIRTEEFQLLGSPHPLLSVGDIALMAGVRTPSGSHWSTTCEIGPGYVMQVDRGEYLRSDPGWFSDSYYGEIDRHAVGLALQSQIYYRSVGLILFGNVNKAESFGGIALSFRIGAW